MGLFTNNKSKESVPVMHIDEELEQDTVNYNSAVDYLVGLSAEDYTKVCEVASIYRKANEDACKALGVDCEPTSFISNPEPEEPEVNILEAEDDLDMAFLDDEPKPKQSKQTVQVEVKKPRER